MNCKVAGEDGSSSQFLSERTSSIGEQPRQPNDQEKMGPIRTNNRFGKRFIRLHELCSYAVDLNLRTHPPRAGLMEFLESEGLLAPVRRIQFSPEMMRGVYQLRHPELTMITPIEQPGPQLEAAAGLMNTLRQNRWSKADIYGESAHVLDALAPEHAPFIQTCFSPASFTAWSRRDLHLYDTETGPVNSSNEQNAPAFYHYWQIFWLAAILRSGVHIYYPLDDSAVARELREGSLTAGSEGRLWREFNLEAYGELRELREFERHFDTVAYYQAYSHNALQVHIRDVDEHGRFPPRQWRQYEAREREIARETLSRSGLHQADIIAFVGKQCEWWDNAQRVGPPAVAEEYKRNINISIDFLRAATSVDGRRVVELVGRRTGHFKPTLEVIFPDWTEEQRDLTFRSLKRWAEDLAGQPAPFPYDDTELNAFCDWLEERGLYQYYWHFRRLVDLRRDDPVHRAASTAEVVNFASLCEMIANEAMTDRGMQPRGKVLFQKLRGLFNPHGPVDLNDLFNQFGKLASTKSQTLPQRLSQIAQIKAGGAHNVVLRSMLSLMVIRNEGSHLGLLRFDKSKVAELIRILAMASLLIWKAR